MNRLAAGLLCAATVGCGSPAPNPSPPPHDLLPPPPTPTSFVLSGHVTDATTSLPIAAALVDAFDGQNNSWSTTSDGTGAFRIAGLSIRGYTVRVRHSGYDSAFLGVGLNGDTSTDFQLTPLMTTLAGTWTGFMEFSPTTGPRQSVTLLTAPLTQAGASLSSVIVPTPTGPTVRFSGTLQDPSAIGSTTGIGGTMTFLTSIVLGRGVTNCQGTTAFTGTTNWTTMSLTVQQITLDCGSSPGITYTNVALSLVKQQ